MQRQVCRISDPPRCLDLSRCKGIQRRLILPILVLARMQHVCALDDVSQERLAEMGYSPSMMTQQARLHSHLRLDLSEESESK